MRTPIDRLVALRRQGSVALTGEPSLVESYSNDTWLGRSPDGEEVVLRVCWIGDRERLLREAAVGEALPRGVGYPAVLDSGSLTNEGETITWSLCRRLVGTSLRRAWPGLTESQRDRALRAVAAPLRALHAWRPPASVLTRLKEPAPTDDLEMILGATCCHCLRTACGTWLRRPSSERRSTRASSRRPGPGSMRMPAGCRCSTIR